MNVFMTKFNLNNCSYLLISIISLFPAHLGWAQATVPSKILITVGLYGLDSPAYAVALSQDGKRFAYGSDHGEIRVIDTISGSTSFLNQTRNGPILALAFSPDGSFLAFSGSLKPSSPTGFKPDPPNLLNAPNELGGNNLGAPWWLRTGDPMTNKNKGEIYLQKKRDYTPYTGSYREAMLLPKKNYLEICETSSGRKLYSFEELKLSINYIHFDKKSKFISYTNENFEFVITRLDDWKPFLNLKPRNLHSQGQGGHSPRTSFARDVFRAVSTDGDRNESSVTLKFFDAEGQRFRVLDPRGSATVFWAVAIAPDGKQFATSGRNGRVYVWDFDRGQVDKALSPCSEDVQGTEFIAYSPDGSQIVTGDKNASLRLWDVATGRLLKKVQAPRASMRAIVFLDHKLRMASGGFHQNLGRVEPLVIWEVDDTAQPAMP